MSFIIVWRNGHRDPHVDLDSSGFLEVYSTYEDAKEAAKQNNDPKSDHFFDYQIYEQVEQ